MKHKSITVFILIALFIVSTVYAADDVSLLHGNSLPVIDATGRTWTNSDTTIDTVNHVFGGGSLAFNGSAFLSSPGVVVIGDSLSHEYRCVPRGNSTSYNWVEILSQKRAVNFGTLNGNCYEFDFAWSGNTITNNLATMVGWALEEFDAGNTSKVVILLGYNDIAGGANVTTLINTYSAQVDRLLTRYAPQNVLAAGIPWEDCGVQNATITNFNAQLATLAANKGIQFEPWTDYCTLLASYAGGNANASTYNYGGQSVARYNWCHVNCLRLPNDGHPGTISQAVIANAMMANFLGVTPVSEAEVLAMMGIGSSPTNTPSHTPTVTPTRTPTRTPTITNTPLPTATPTPFLFTCTFPQVAQAVQINPQTISLTCQ